MLLTESKLTEVLTEGLKYHLDTKTPLYENVYRPGSEAYFSTIKQARHLMNKGILTELCLEDMELLFETEVGEFGMFKGKKVPLDFPMLNEITVIIPSPAASWKSASQEPAVMQMGEDRWINLAGKAKAAGGLGYKTKYSDIKSFLGQLGTPTITFSDTDEVQMPTVLKYMEGEQVNYKVVAGENVLASLIEEDPDPDVWVVDLTEESTELSEYKGYSEEIGKYLATWANIFDAMLEAYKKGNLDAYISSLSGTARKAANAFKQFIEDNATALTEAKYQGKEVALNKPKRGGSKAYYVYTRNPKTGKVIKVSFGSGGLKAKINNPEARRNFAARHNCAAKKDKTKAGYWSCRLPRYASLLGLKSSFGGYW